MVKLKRTHEAVSAFDTIWMKEAAANVGHIFGPAHNEPVYRPVQP